MVPSEHVKGSRPQIHSLLLQDLKIFIAIENNVFQRNYLGFYRLFDSDTFTCIRWLALCWDRPMCNLNDAFIVKIKPSSIKLLSDHQVKASPWVQKKTLSQQPLCHTFFYLSDAILGEQVGRNFQVRSNLSFDQGQLRWLQVVPEGYTQIEQFFNIMPLRFGEEMKSKACSTTKNTLIRPFDLALWASTSLNVLLLQIEEGPVVFCKMRLQTSPSVSPTMTEATLEVVAIGPHFLIASTITENLHTRFFVHLADSAVQCC